MQACNNCGGTGYVSEYSMLTDLQRRQFDELQPMIGFPTIMLCAPCQALTDLLILDHPDIRDDLHMLIETPLGNDPEEARRFLLHLLVNGYEEFPPLGMAH